MIHVFPRYRESWEIYATLRDSRSQVQLGGGGKRRENGQPSRGDEPRQFAVFASRAVIAQDHGPLFNRHCP